MVAQAVGFVARPVERTHQLIADRVFGMLGSVAGPVRVGHDVIAAMSYGAVRGTALLAGEAVAATSALGRPRMSLDGSVAGSGVVAAVNGLLGDRLAAQANDLDLGMSLRHAGRDLPVRTADLRAAYPGASSHLVLLVPGLGETEHAWRFRRSRGVPAGPDYGVRLAVDLGATPLYVRYNTGRSLATNASALCDLVEALLAGWPVPVGRVDLIGHSMGGLVVRLACAHGVARGARWPELVRHVVYLGSPHAGASLARSVTAVSGLLSARPATEAWAEFLDLRSAGIGDLAGGVPPAGSALLPSARHHSVVAELTGSERHPVSRLLGDLLVASRSADIGVGDRLRIAPAHHFDLLNHPLVYRALRNWLHDTAPPPRPPH
ncbi:permease [Pseudonocardia eucalypti]|uniref:Permease n=1 Tax=Pseudonocardia eucalypti TaxID=648755 RepID=A0ABP9QT13_9PSEU